MTKLILKAALALAAVLMMAGCATDATVRARVDFGPAYTPIAEVSENEQRRNGLLYRFTYRVRNVIPENVGAVYERAEKLRSRCVYGVKEEDRQQEVRRNPDVSPYHRPPHAIAAMIYGKKEQIHLVDVWVTFECHMAPQQSDPRMRR